MDREPPENQKQQTRQGEALQVEQRELRRVDRPAPARPHLPEGEQSDEHERRGKHRVDRERTQQPQDQRVGAVDVGGIEHEGADVVDDEEREDQGRGVDWTPRFLQVSAEG